VIDPLAEIRRATASDVARLAAVGQATFLETFAGVLDGNDIVAHCAHQHSVDYYARALAEADARAWLAEVAPGGAPVGYLTTTAHCAQPVADLGPDDVEIKRIYVLHRFFGAGVGARLMRAAVDDAHAAGKRRILLGVYSGNERALAFYARHGFRTIGRRRFEVGANHYDDVVLARELPPPG
jgi:ribosomal protein S18 acetylase RimI-like enzyme